ncbi:MAG: hypothetical protein HY680_03440 [Chloroflexi bacterium]|nr:hypothetical protein [Chloroflexota bacterium]
MFDDRERPVSNALVQGDQGHLDPVFLRALTGDLDRILCDPDKMDIVDSESLRIIRK